jgi:hypothetical protein
MQNFLFAKVWSATWFGAACSTKQGPYKRKNRCTQFTDVLSVVHVRQKLQGCFVLRNRMLFPFGSVKDPQGIKPVEEMG